MNKYDAVVELIREYHSSRGSNAAAKRCVKAAEVLGLSDTEIVHLMSYLDYCDWNGNAYGTFKHVWPDMKKAGA